MSRATAIDLWGAGAVAAALEEPEHELVSAELVSEVHRRADPPGAFRAWSLTLPWPRFCAVVRLVSGATRQSLLGGEDVETTPLTMRVPPEVIGRLDALAELLTARLPVSVARPVSRAGAAREALERGLAALERELGADAPGPRPVEGA